MLRDIGVVLRKELKDLSRDKRTLRSMAGILLGLPLLYIVLIGVIQSQFNEQMERTIQAAIVGCSDAAELCDFLKEHRVEITPLQSYDAEIIAQRKKDLVLIIPTNFAQDLSEFRKPKLVMWFDEAEDKSSFGAKRVGRLLDVYQSTLAYRSSILRGVDPSVLQALRLEAKSIRPEKGFGSSSVQLFITTLLMACFMSTYHLAVDTVAGEKERNTLESLMQTATSRTAFLLGKWLMIVLVASFGMTVTALIFKLLCQTGPMQSILGGAGDFSWNFVLTSLLLCLPIVLMATALQFMIGTLSRSVKEAQAYASLLSLLGILPASFAQVLEKVSSSIWMPNIGQTLAMLRLGRGQPVNWLACLSASGLTLLLAGLFITVIYRSFYSEKLFRSGT